MSAVRAHILISGRVQGVSFRYHTRRQAEKAGLAGWVRNLWSGQVEAVLEGEREAVEQVLEWCRHGPPSARVDDVRVQWREPAGDWQAFNIRATASEVND